MKTILTTSLAVASVLCSCKKHEVQTPPDLDQEVAKVEAILVKPLSNPNAILVKPNRNPNVVVIKVKKPSASVHVYSKKLIDGIRHFENDDLASGKIKSDTMRYDRYGKCTEIGYGFTSNLIDMAQRAGKLPKGYKYPKSFTEAEASSFLINTALPACEYYVDKYVKAKLTRRQKEALIMFTYNLGPHALKMLVDGHSKKYPHGTRLNSGEYKHTPNIMKLYVKAGGKTLKGLVRRRNYEANLFTM